ncbi:hypothetical protein H0H93_012223, partial [Arthromyces matolae]
MGQSWRFFNLDSPIAVTNSVAFNFDEFYFIESGKFDDNMLRALWRPDEGEKRVEVLPACRAKYIEVPEAAFANTTDGPIGQLASETICQILDRVEILPDLLSFMSTCQRLWDIGRPLLAAKVDDIYGTSWAGDRLLILGDYGTFDDLPDGMLQDSELEFINSFVVDYYTSEFQVLKELQRRNHHRNFDAEEDLAGRVWREGKVMYSDGPFEDDFSHGTGVFASSQWEQYYHSYSLFDMNRSLALRSLVTFKDQDLRRAFYKGTMVLRNLTTKEFISWKSFTSDDISALKLDLDKLSFEHLLYRRLLWSSDSSMHLWYSETLKLHRGVWAGHRFDVCHIRNVRDEDGLAMDDWKDVSKEVLADIAAA